ncbi:helix-turn-helix domain-containing protein [Nitratidesulfovibrio sp. 1201_IL3209]|uniref:helix-turn-helix domain-containing protein n=1 Tax=Nitratidesulfovibrio sp. 1201_IL3209 TaxID=3084053 RepID=UPI003FA5C3F4
MTRIGTRRLSRLAQEAIRMKVVRAVFAKGMSQTEAAKVFGVSRTTVCLWGKAFREKGEKALKTKRQGRPPGQAQQGTGEWHQEIHFGPVPGPTAAAWTALD